MKELLHIPKKTDKELEQEMKDLLLGKHRIGSKNWFLQKSMNAIMVQQGLSVEQALKYMVETHKKNHKDLYYGNKTIQDIAEESKKNIEKAKKEGIL